MSACNEKTNTDNPPIVKQTEIINFDIPDSTYVILDYKSDWYWVFKDAKPSTLTENELVEIENIIETAIKENNARQKGNLERHNKEFPDNQWIETGFELTTKDFKRQYVPVVNKNGQKVVWINFFCNDWESDSWKSDILIVNDGGNCYFNLKVNLDTKTYSELSINGYA